MCFAAVPVFHVRELICHPLPTVATPWHPSLAPVTIKCRVRVMHGTCVWRYFLNIAHMKKINNILQLLYDVCRSVGSLSTTFILSNALTGLCTPPPKRKEAAASSGLSLPIISAFLVWLSCWSECLRGACREVAPPLRACGDGAHGALHPHYQRPSHLMRHGVSR